MLNHKNIIETNKLKIKKINDSYEYTFITNQYEIIASKNNDCNITKVKTTPKSFTFKKAL